MKRIGVFFLLLIIAVVIFYRFSKEKEIDLSYPYVFRLEGTQNKYFCEALVGSVIEAPVKDIGGIKKGVRARVFKATDKLSIEIKGDKLYSLTRASFEAGDSRDENPFTIIYNDEHKVLAIDEINSNLIVNVFALNKDTGIANWAKIRTDFILTGNPDSQSYCLKCEPR